MKQSLWLVLTFFLNAPLALALMTEPEAVQKMQDCQQQLDNQIKAQEMEIFNPIYGVAHPEYKLDGGAAYDINLYVQELYYYQCANEAMAALLLNTMELIARGEYPQSALKEVAQPMITRLEKGILFDDERALRHYPKIAQEVITHFDLREIADEWVRKKQAPRLKAVNSEKP